jgi:hypothetical protein
MTRPLLAVDTETTGLRPFQGDKATVFSFAVHEDDGIAAWAEAPDKGARTLQRFIDEGYTIVNHNGPFDRAVFATLGVTVPDDQYADTQARDWLLDENRDHRLKEGLGRRYLGIDASAEKKAVQALLRGTSQADAYRAIRAVENEKPRAERRSAAECRAEARQIAADSKRTYKDLGIDDDEFREYAEQDAFLTLHAHDRQDACLFIGRTFYLTYPKTKNPYHVCVTD